MARLIASEEEEEEEEEEYRKSFFKSAENFGITMEDGPPKSFYFFLNFLEVVEPKRSST